MTNASSIEKTLEMAAYRCDIDTFCDFMKRVETALENGNDTKALEKEIHDAIYNTRSRVFNIHKVANDATTNLQDHAVA